MNKWWTVSAKLFLCLLIALTIGCAGHLRADREEFADVVSGIVGNRGAVELRGWAVVHGEIMLYSDRSSMLQQLRFPYCISAVFTDQYERDFSEFDGEKVVVTGVLYDFWTLPDESGPRAEILPRRALNGVVVSNWCYGDNVLLLNSIELTN
jgi:hypothetical protein